MGRYWFLATGFSLLDQVRKKAVWVEFSVCRGSLVTPHLISPPLQAVAFHQNFTFLEKNLEIKNSLRFLWFNTPNANLRRNLI